MFYQRSHIKYLFRNYTGGTATAQQLIELKAGMKVFTEDEMLGIMGESLADPFTSVSGQEISSALDDARELIARSGKKNNVCV